MLRYSYVQQLSNWCVYFPDNFHAVGPGSKRQVTRQGRVAKLSLEYVDDMQITVSSTCHFYLQTLSMFP